MGTYENPAKAPINTNGRVLGQGIQRMLTGYASDKLAQKNKKARDAQEAKLLLDKRSQKAEQNFLTGFDAIDDDINKFSGSLSGENRNVFKDEIVNLLDGKRDEISQWIKDNPEAGPVAIQDKINSGTEYMGNLQQTLGGLQAARQEYLAARDLRSGEEGAILANHNPELIKFFEAQERNDPNMQFTVDDDGSFRISVVNEGELKDAMNTMGDDQKLEFTSFNASNLVKSYKDGNPFFRTVQPFDYTEITETIDESIRNGDKDLGTVDSKGNITYNKAGVKDYYVNDPSGQAILASYSQGSDQMGNWVSLGEETLGEDGVISHTNTIENFSEGALGEGILNGLLNDMPDQPPLAPKSPTKPKEEVVEEEVVEPAEVAEEEVETVTYPGGHLTKTEINNRSEEDVAKALTEKYGEYFEITEQAPGVDQIRIMDKTDRSKFIYVDLNTGYNKKKSDHKYQKIDGDAVYKKIIDFIKENSPKAKPSAEAKTSTKQKPSATTKSSVL
jgi:hypothetical protein